MNISMPADKLIIELPQIITIDQPFVLFMFWWLGIFFVSLLLKILGKGPNMKGAIVSALSILIMYVACALIYKFEPAGLDEYLAPLPFVQFQGDNLVLGIYELEETGKIAIPKFCSQIISMFVLAFLVNQVYFFKPGNLKSPGWLVFRLFSTMICIGVHFAVHKVMMKALGMIPHGSLLEEALPFLPIGFMVFMLFVFLLGWAKHILKYFFKVVNPTFEGLSGFFYVNKFGVIVTRAIYTTVILTLFAYCLQHKCEEIFMAPVVPLVQLQLPGLAALGALIILWMIVGHML